MDAMNVALGLGWVVAFGGGALWLALRESNDWFTQMSGGFDKWADHLRGCTARKDSWDDCSCGLADFRDALDGD